MWADGRWIDWLVNMTISMQHSRWAYLVEDELRDDRLLSLRYTHTHTHRIYSTPQHSRAEAGLAGHLVEDELGDDRLVAFGVDELDAQPPVVLPGVVPALWKRGCDCDSGNSRLVAVRIM